MTTQQQKPEMSSRWTRQILESCTPREILVLIIQYGAEQIARQMGYTDVEKFAKERAAQ